MRSLFSAVVFVLVAAAPSRVAAQASAPTTAPLTTGSALSQVSRGVVGVWQLKQWCDINPATGVATYRLGDNPTGLFVYTPGGHLMIQFMRTPPVPPFVGGDNAPTEAEMRGLLGSYSSYFGTYTITSDTTVTHHVTGGTYASYTGTDQFRHFRLRSGGREAPDTLSIGGYPVPMCRTLVRVE